MPDKRETKYTKKAFKDLEFTDDFMFRTVLEQDTGLCARLIELLLDVKIDHVELKGTDHTIKFNTDIKSIRLDVYLSDEAGTVYDLEMQVDPGDDLPRRSRYYQGMVDRDNLLRGKSYDMLPDSYIVFICTFDPFHRKLHKYEFRELCLTDPDIELDDGTSRVFINAKGRRDEASDDMKGFLDYLCGMPASTELTKDIEEGIAQVKTSRSLAEEYMTFGEELERVKMKAFELKGFDDVDRLVAAGMADEERACEVLGVDIEKYREYKAGEK